LTRAWLQRGPLACALWPLSLLFGALSRLRRLLYRRGALPSTRLGVPVIVVGNIFIGGTGKTPLTIWLVAALQQAGFRPGVISRGHGSADTASTDKGNSDQVGSDQGSSGKGSSGKGSSDNGSLGQGGVDRKPRLVTSSSSAQQVGDEPLLIAQRAGCPVMVGRDRVAAGRALLECHPELDIIISDDGLQHYALQRDIEIVLFDGRANGNGWLLPAGPLRESISRRRDFTVLNVPPSATNAPYLPESPESSFPASPPLAPALLARLGPAGTAVIEMQLVGEFAERLSCRSERISLAQLAQSGQSIVAAAGIGNPGRFFSLLKNQGLLFRELALPDHHAFLDRPFAGIVADVILITEKDAVKCMQIEELNDDPRLWVIPVNARIDAVLAQHIVEKCRGCSIA
jgi:tetraacyldisaccharide 4'-kinase